MAGRLFLGFFKLVLLTVLAGVLGGAFWVCAQIMTVQAGMVLAVAAAWLAWGVLALLRRAEDGPVSGWRQGTPANWGQRAAAVDGEQES